MTSINTVIVTNRPRIINFPYSDEIIDYSKLLIDRYKSITDKVKIKKYIYEDINISNKLVEDIEYSLFINKLLELISIIDESFLAYHNPVTYEYLKRRKVTDEQIFNYKIIESFGI